MYNAFEKCLLIQFLQKRGKNERAKEIALSMTLHMKSDKISFENYKNKFDTVLNSKQP